MRCPAMSGAFSYLYTFVYIRFGGVKKYSYICVMTQQEFFSNTQTDNLLRMRYVEFCSYPVNEGDKPDYADDSNGKIQSWYIDKKLLYDELAKRPHRVRAKDRRKKKSK